MGILGFLLVIVIAAALYCVSLYNGIVTKSNRCDTAWQTIDTQLQRRYDLIPNLVETIQGYASHEKSTLEDVIKARSAAIAAPTPEAAMEANQNLTGALRQLLAVAEAYPDLKANTNFLQLQSELTETENKISYARQSYNDCVLMYNNAITTFPGTLIASHFGFTTRKGFEVASAEARQAPKVEFK